MNEPTSQQIDAVLRFLPVLKQPGLVTSKWHIDEKDENGLRTFPWEELSPEISDLMTALNENGFVEEFDWPSWQETAGRYVDDPKRLQRANVMTLKKLLTTHVRKDRFCEGHFTSMIRCGHITAVLERLAELRPLNRTTTRRG